MYVQHSAACASPASCTSLARDARQVRRQSLPPSQSNRFCVCLQASLYLKKGCAHSGIWGATVQTVQGSGEKSAEKFAKQISSLLSLFCFASIFFFLLCLSKVFSLDGYLHIHRWPQQEKQASLDKHSQLDMLYKSSPTSFKQQK